MSDFNDSDLDDYLADDTGGPVVMLNLLRFAEGGRERYDEYAEAITAVGETHGIQLVYFGTAGRPLQAPDGPAWDAVALVRYPSRTAFAAMIRSPEYQAIEHLRAEALADTVLQPTDALVGG